MKIKKTHPAIMFGGAALAVLVVIALVVCTALFAPMRYAPDDRVFEKSWATDNNGYAKEGADVERLISVRPTPLQVEYSNMGYYSFIHYGMNTFTDREWGTGEEDPAQFNPIKVDTDQWVRVLKESGSQGVIFTVKHHDGFCLWPSAYTEHSIKNSPYMDGKGDIVKQVSDSCKKYGMKFGIYLSPWDMHEETYGTDAYNDFFVNQLTELCTNYGELFAIWFDGAKGEDAPDFEYDLDRYFAVIRELQPNCVIANQGPDVRWIGNEAADTRESEWSVISRGSESAEAIEARSQQNADDTSKLQAVASDAEDVGSREVVLQYKTLAFKPAEADVSIRKGWFYHESEDNTVKSAETLTDMYYRTVGGNAFFLLNVPPNREGVIAEPDVQVLQAFGKQIADDFSKPIENASVMVGNANDMRQNEQAGALLNGDTSYMFEDNAYILDIDLEKPCTISRVVLQEDLAYSQRIEAFDVYVKTDGYYKKADACTVVGSKKICKLDENRRNPEKAEGIRIVIRQSRSNPVLRSIQLYEKP